MEGSLRVLGVDLALHRSGWAVTRNGETILGSGVIDSGPRNRSYGEMGRRLEEELWLLLDEFRPTAIYLEGHTALGSHLGRQAATAEALGAAKMAASMAIRDWNQSHEPVVVERYLPVAKWRELFCGSRMARKETTWTILQHMGLLQELPPKRDCPEADRADACAIALTGWRLENVERLLPAAPKRTRKARKG